MSKIWDYHICRSLKPVFIYILQQASQLFWNWVVYNSWTPINSTFGKNTTFTTLPHQPAQSFFQITGTDGFLQHKFMCTKVPRVVEIKIERRLTHVTFTQKTRVCIPCETNCHQAFLKPNDVNLNQINTGLVRQGGELMHGGPRAS